MGRQAGVHISHRYTWGNKPQQWWVQQSTRTTHDSTVMSVGPRIVFEILKILCFICGCTIGSFMYLYFHCSAFSRQSCCPGLCCCRPLPPAAESVLRHACFPCCPPLLLSLNSAAERRGMSAPRHGTSLWTGCYVKVSAHEKKKGIIHFMNMFSELQS